jgi:tetratricopeptide (TPR) repeat protein/DNA-binding PadR family transcriptional regulator
MAGELTVSERILYHLNNYVKYEDKYEAPFDVTQDGISQACSISRAHAAIELKKLKASGIVDETLKHVRKGKARRKVYFLTTNGKSKAADVLQYVRDNSIIPMVDPAKVSPESISRSKTIRRSSPLPTVRDFFGRGKELEDVNQALASPTLKVLSIRGIAGIGKTTLVAKAVSGLSGQRVFWYSAKPWDVPRTLADALGRFFAENGSRKLSTYLASGKFELGELSFLLNEELAENGYTLVLDDVDASDNLQEFLKMFRHSSGSAKMIVTSEADPKLYDPSDMVAKKEVREIELEGLEKKAALELLRSRNIEGSVADELIRVTHGHPLSLEMVTESSPTGAKYQVARFFEEKFYAGLPEEEKSLLQLASVFQQPFSTDAIPRELRQARRGSMLREVAPGRFEIHASLRDFVYSSMTKDERAKWHSIAADHYLKVDNSQERLFHLIRANRVLEAEMMMSRMSEELLAEGNVQRLWETVSFFEASKPKYAHSVMLLKARAASLVGDYNAAWSLLERTSRESEGRLGAEALVEMGKIKSKKGELKNASRLFSEALDGAKEIPGVRAKALRGLGVVESKLGNYSKAQELLEKSAVDALSVMDSKGMLLAHMELGSVFIGRGMYEDAIEHFSKCAAGFGPVDLTNVYVNLGIACAFLGRSNEAKLHLENAVRLADETGQPRSKAYALTSLAEELIKSGSVELAKEHCFRALEIVTELDDKLGMSAVYANLGMVERSSKNWKASEEYFYESIAALDGMDVPRSLGMRKMEFAQLKAQAGDLVGARIQLEESRSLFNKVGARDLVSRTELELARLSEPSS